jgi:regulator of protease activity HflC (stomatin/prohibitin superfamily)
MDWWVSIVILLVLILILVATSIRIVYQYEAGVVFRLGRLKKTRAPGIRFIIPFIERMRKVDTRVITMDVPSQEAITRDNVTLKVNAVVYFRVMHPEAAIVEVYDFKMATYQIAQTTLRSVLGQSDLDDLLTRRDKINAQLQQIIDEQTEPWGIKVSTVEVKDVELPLTMQRAMAAQAESERDKRAKLIHAEGELQASEKLAEAGAVIGKDPATLQLRYLQTLVTIATEKSQIMVFPLPMDLLSAFMPKKE